jgi:hypothetical protein
MLAPVASRVISELCEKILARERVYCSALAADIAVLTKAVGEGPMREALALLGARQADGSDRWDRNGHELAVRRGLARAIFEHQTSPENFKSATEV